MFSVLPEHEVIENLHVFLFSCLLKRYKPEYNSLIGDWYGHYHHKKGELTLNQSGRKTIVLIAHRHPGPFEDYRQGV